MFVLAIESSSSEGSVALLSDQPAGPEVLASERLPAGERSAKSLFKTLDRVLAAPGVRDQGIGLVCVTSGPGSFTGLRVGISAIKMLAYCWKCPSIGVSTLQVIAMQTLGGWGSVGVSGWSAASGVAEVEAVLDAQRQEIFMERFSWQQGTPWTDLKPAGDGPRIVGRDQWLGELVPGRMVAGPPLATLAAKVPSGVLVASADVWEPQATTVGRLGLAQWKAGAVSDPFALMPHYVRASAAEEKASQRGGV